MLSVDRKKGCSKKHFVIISVLSSTSLSINWGDGLPWPLRTEQCLNWKDSCLLLINILHPFYTYMWLTFKLNVGYSKPGTLFSAPPLQHQQFPKMKSINSETNICKHQLTELTEYVFIMFLHVSFTEHINILQTHTSKSLILSFKNCYST